MVGAINKAIDIIKIVKGVNIIIVKVETIIVIKIIVMVVNREESTMDIIISDCLLLMGVVNQLYFQTVKFKELIF